MKGPVLSPSTQRGGTGTGKSSLTENEFGFKPKLEEMSDAPPLENDPPPQL